MQVTFLLFIDISTIEYFNEKHIKKIVRGKIADTSIVIDLITYSNIHVYYTRNVNLFSSYTYSHCTYMGARQGKHYLLALYP